MSHIMHPDELAPSHHEPREPLVQSEEDEVGGNRSI